MSRHFEPSSVCAALALVLAAAAGCGEKPAANEAVAPEPNVGPEAKAEPAAPTPAEEAEETVAAEVDAGGLVVLALELPKPAFIGTPPNVPPGTTVVMKPEGWRRPPFMAPAGLTNVALDKLVSASDEEPIIGEVDLVTDGDKEAADGSYVELGPGVQWVQIDLEETCEVFAVLFWYYHGDPRVYHDVVVQAADDADFITGVKTIFSNDQDNSAGLGLGTEPEYFETHEGMLVDAKGVKTRYVRVYANGSTADELNRFTEIEVFGRSAE